MGVDLLNIKGLNEADHQGPIVMVNLMRFRARSLDGDGSGWDAYLRYSALTVPMIKARGGTLLWTGDAKAVALGDVDAVKWDYLALVYYPDVAAFGNAERNPFGVAGPQQGAAARLDHRHGVLAVALVSVPAGTLTVERAGMKPHQVQHYHRTCALQFGEAFDVQMRDAHAGLLVTFTGIADGLWLHKSLEETCHA